MTWNALPHDPIEHLADNLLRVEADLPGVTLRRQMIVVRAPTGALTLHNGVALTEPAMAQITAFGTPTTLVVPNGWHRIDAAAYLARFPDLTVVCPRGARAKVAKRVPVALTYDAVTPTKTVRFEHLRGLGEVEGVMTVQSADGVTLVFNDALFNQPHLPGLFGTVYRLLGQSGHVGVPLLVRMVMLRNKRAYADHLRELAETPGLVRVIPGHITPITENPAAVLRQVADQLAAP